MPMDLSIHSPATIADDLLLQVIRLKRATWPKPEHGAIDLVASRAELMAKPGCRLHLGCVDGMVVAHAEVFLRDIRIGGAPQRVVALAGVCVDQSRRGSGYGRDIVLAAFAEVGPVTAPTMLFQTKVPDFYDKLGCRRVGNRFVNSLGADPQARPWWNDFTLIYPATAPWGEGVVDLLGPAY